MKLEDRYGRVAHDLRVSLIDRCNLRCSYCMPAEGLPWLPKDSVLTDAEVVRLVRIGVELLDVDEVRFTGGEPLLRSGLEDIIFRTARLATPPKMSLTTNALGLDKRAEGLRAAGLERVNISLDTLDRERFAAITRRDRIDDVLAGITAAQDAGLSPVKINAVPMRDYYRDDAPALLEFCLREGLQLRFIEQMPLGPPGSWDRSTVVTADDVRAALVEAGFELAALAERTSAPAVVQPVSRRSVSGEELAGTVGFIASVSAPFCADCTRTRLTADGKVRSCLFSARETDLRGLLRRGADDVVIAMRWQEAMWGKPKAHGLDDPGFAIPNRTMSSIGG